MPGSPQTLSESKYSADWEWSNPNSLNAKISTLSKASSSTNPMNELCVSPNALPAHPADGVGPCKIYQKDN